MASILLFVLMLFRMTLLLRHNQRQADALERLNRLDPLTGAANRRGLEERMQIELVRARRNGSSLVVAFLDLDFFKQYNDEHGHVAGDARLVELVSSWQANLRETDLLARYGGEEFVLLCPDTSEGEGVRIVERLRASVPYGQSCSAGITMCRGDETMEALLERADHALYEAKQQGRDRSVTAA